MTLDELAMLAQIFKQSELLENSIPVQETEP
jgi:hypothetical protein